MESINTVFIMAGSLIVLAFIILQWFLRKDSRDKKIVRRPPHNEPLSQQDLEIATKEWQQWRSAYQSLPVHEKNRKQNEYLNKERAYRDECDAFSEAQKPYQVACEEMEIVWKNYRDVFNSLGFAERWFPGETSRELARLRQVYQEVERKVEWEKDKWYSRRRIKRVEEESQVQPEEPAQAKIEQIEEDSTGSNDDPIQEDTLELLEGEVEQPENKDTDNTESEPLETFSPEIDLEAGLLAKEPEIEEVHFTQDDIQDFYPNFAGKTYIDENYFPDPFYAASMKKAVFNRARFVGVHFKGIHQYQKCLFRATDFSAAVFHPAKKPHRFLYCDFARSRWNGAEVDVAAFYLCKFKAVDFGSMTLKRIKFVQCDLSEAILEGADFAKCVMSRDMLDSLDFSVCENPPSNYQELEPPLEEIESDQTEERIQEESATESEDVDDDLVGTEGIEKTSENLEENPGGQSELD